MSKSQIEALENILNNKGIAECKIESGETFVIVEIKRTKTYPPKK